MLVTEWSALLKVQSVLFTQKLCTGTVPLCSMYVATQPYRWCIMVSFGCFLCWMICQSQRQDDSTRCTFYYTCRSSNTPTYITSTILCLLIYIYTSYSIYVQCCVWQISVDCTGHRMISAIRYRVYCSHKNCAPARSHFLACMLLYIYTGDVLWLVLAVCYIEWFVSCKDRMTASFFFHPYHLSWNSYIHYTTSSSTPTNGA